MVTVTLRLDSKSSGFCAVAYTDVFSQLLTSYVGMRRKPYARGGCHVRNYKGVAKFPLILRTNVDRSHRVPMEGEATGTTAVDSTPWFVAFATPWAGLRGVRFFLQSDLHPILLSFVGEFVAYAAR